MQLRDSGLPSLQQSAASCATAGALELVHVPHDMQTESVVGSLGGASAPTGDTL